MSKDYHPLLCIPVTPNEKWLNHLLNNFYATENGEVYKKRNGFKPVGSLNSKGYRQVCLRLNGEQKNFKIHHLIWLLKTGEFPTMELNHKNKDRSDNRFSNLEQVTREENLAYRNIEQDTE